MTDPSGKRMSLIVTKGTLDGAYPPFILATTAAGMGLGVSMFFTFYGLHLLKKDIDHLKISPLGNPAMQMPFAGMHLELPNLAAILPGADAGCAAMMKRLVARKKIPTISELRNTAIELGVHMVGCEMTMDLFEIGPEQMIDGVEIAGAASYVETALASDINLYL